MGPEGGGTAGDARGWTRRGVAGVASLSLPPRTQANAPHLDFPEIPVLSGAISPDGKYVAYSDSSGLHLKVLGTAEARTLSWPPGSASGATWNVAGWFPDGTQLLPTSSSLAAARVHGRFR